VKGSQYFPLIKYLLRNGYIDEDYPDYMSYFYEQSISRTDQIFIRSILDVEKKPYTYKLNDPAKVAKRINKRYLSQPQILNFDLFQYYLESRSLQLSIIIDQIRENQNIDFIFGFWHTGHAVQLLFSTINAA